MNEELRETIALGVYVAVPLGEFVEDPDYMADCYYQADKILAEIETAGYVLVERDLLGRIGLALWSMIEEEEYTDDILGLEPGDRATIPGALTGDLDGDV